MICYSAERCPFIDPRYARTHTAAPVQIGERTLGVLCVASSVSHQSTVEDTSLLSGLAALAAIAIRSNELHEQGHQLAVLSERDRISRDLHDNTLQALYGVNLALEYAARIDRRGRTRSQAAAGRDAGHPQPYHSGDSGLYS